MNNFWRNSALVLTIVGGLNWGLIGAFDFDLVAFLFGPMSILSRVVYILVGLSALATLVMPAYSFRENLSHNK